MSVVLRALRRRSQESWTGIVRTVRDYATGTDPRDDYEPILGSLPDEETERQAHGVAEIEALATVWSTRTLYTGYALYGTAAHGMWHQKLIGSGSL